LELKRSDYYYDITALTYNHVVKIYPQAKVKRIIQFCAYYLKCLGDNKKSVGSYLEFIYRMFTVDRHSYSYILQGLQLAKHASPFLDGMPLYICAIVRPQTNRTAEELIEIVMMFRGHDIRAMVAIMLSRIGHGVQSKLTRLKREDYNVANGTLQGFVLPEWANNFVKYSYVQGLESYPDNTTLFPYNYPKSKRAKEKKLHLSGEIERVRKEHKVDVWSLSRYINYWRPIRSDQYYFFGGYKHGYYNQIARLSKHG